jgi:hypothetical protein
MSSSRIKKLLLFVVVIPIVLFTVFTTMLYVKQDTIVKELVQTLNEDFVGEVEIRDSHISPFANFPYISIDLEDVKIFQNKDKSKAPILDIKDIYLGFDLWTLISGKFDVKSLKLKDGRIEIIQDINGEFNISKALESTKEIEDAGEEFHIDLKRIELKNIDITKLNEENKILLDVFITKAQSKFKTSDEHTMVSLDSKFELTVLKDGDTTFVKHKHFDVDTRLDYVNATQKLKITPSEIYLEGALFKMQGDIDFDDDMNLDLVFEGQKPNFDLFIAFAPEELAPALKKYENKGKVYFDCSIKGKSTNGHNPKIDANFGCSDAYFSNTINKKKLDELQFKGHFTNGEKRNPSTMEFSMTDFSARPEAGTFSGNLTVKNFESPEIDLKLISQFELDFLANFLNLTDLKDLKGSVKLTMNFRDIIDLEHPERSIEKLNESYYTELKVDNLSFSSPDYHLPLKDLDISAVMDGHQARIDYFNLKVGKSDISINGTVSDLPAIMHHTSTEVLTNLNISSKYLDLYELTNSGKDSTKPFDEQIENFSMKLAFKSSAKALTESPNLPVGEFFIEDLYAKMKHYPHTLHDFHADVIIDERDFRIIDFTGMIDKSDFHFSGKLRNYDLWFNEDPKGDTKIEFAVDSKLLQLEDIFTYGGENFVPEDYRHEEMKQLKVHGFADLHFSKGLKSADVYLDQFKATMKVHPMRFEKFSGRIHVEDEHLTIEKLTGKIGKSSFLANMTYYYGADKKIKKRDNKLYLSSSYLDFDELFNYNPPPANATSTPADHEAVFNIYDVPFPDMSFYFDIKHLRYHRYILDDFYSKFRTTEKHYIYIDTMSLLASGGSFDVKGYFNGSNRNKIYFSPNMKLKNVDLDKLMFKFENFGQDHLVSEQLHGKLTGRLYGKLHMHADMVPIIDDSEIHLDVEVTKGRLENYGPMQYLSDYFKDKNLNKILFDTLANHIDIANGVTNIPKMTINSSLGFIELSGKQDMDFNFEYYLRVPLKMVSQAGMSKLFGKKADEIDTEKEDEIITKDASKNVRYVNIKMKGNTEDYKITLAKDKKR